jgi:catalase
MRSIIVGVLIDELRARVGKAPVTFHIEAQIAQPGDVTNDPTIAWRDSRKVVNLGTITVTSAVANNDEAERKIGFLPNKTVDGLGLSDDPFLDARAAAYGVAYGKRQ